MTARTVAPGDHPPGSPRPLRASWPALLHFLVRNHALADVNKRLGWLATVVFLDIDGQPAELDDGDAFDLVVSVAEGCSDLREIAGRLTGA